MNFIEIFGIGIGLAMDAFAVSVCKGLSMKKFDWKKAIIIGVYFGFFQAIMPIIGFLIGSKFYYFISGIDHWVIFIILSSIGINMIVQAFSKVEETIDDDTNLKTMIMLSLATSIDALAVGITFSLLHTNILFAIATIGIITLILSFIGVRIGNSFGNKFEKKAEFVGGAVLILIAIKIILEHLYII